MRTTSGANATEVKRMRRTTSRVPYPGSPRGGAMPENAANVKSCGPGRRVPQSGLMEPTTLPTELPLRPQDEVECRRCEVHCDKVVYPASCLSRSCPFVYAYEAWGHTYVGCMQKIFEVELDLELLRAGERRR